MKTETPKDAAQKIVTEWADFHQLDNIGPMTKARLVTTIESALRNRDERAAKIADRFADIVATETMPTLVAQRNTATGIADEIRGKD